MAFELPGRLLIGTEQYRTPAKVASVMRAGRSPVLIVSSGLSPSTAGVDPEAVATRFRMPFHVWVNTSGAQTSGEAVAVARSLCAGSGSLVVKLDIYRSPTDRTPVNAEVLEAARQLVSEFHVLPFVTPDPEVVAELLHFGCGAVRVLGSPIGSGQGIRDLRAFKAVRERAVGLLVAEGGFGNPWQAAQAMELGADAVLVNTAIATAARPEALARAFRLAVSAGRMAFETQAAQ